MTTLRQTLDAHLGAITARDLAALAATIDERSVLSLVFRRRADGWRMIHDQNTPCR